MSGDRSEMDMVVPFYNNGYEQGDRNLYLGIDPGAAGGFCLMREDGDVFIMQAFKKMTVSDVATTISIHSGFIKMAVLERVGAMPGQGVSSTFKFGMNFGLWQGMLITAGIAFELKVPRVWQKAFAIKPRDKKRGETGTDFKNRVKAHAQQLFPQTSARITHDVADALLIAEYARRVYAPTNV